MAVFRTKHDHNFTIMSNYHLQDERLSMKAKGLLSVCLSLPDSREYSINGLAAISKEGRDAVLSTIRELEQAGYIVRGRARDEHGRLQGAEYSIYEVPQNITEDVMTDLPDAALPEITAPDTPTREKPEQDNTRQLSTKESKTNIINDLTIKREIDKEKGAGAHDFYGMYQNVSLSGEEMQQLMAEYPQDCGERIERLSEYMASTGKRYDNHMATIRSWARREKEATFAKPATYNAANATKRYSHDKYTCEAWDSL